MVQAANFDLDPVDVRARRMVKTEKALDYFGGDVFGCLAQVANLSLVFS